MSNNPKKLLIRYSLVRHSVLTVNTFYETFQKNQIYRKINKTLLDNDQINCDLKVLALISMANKWVNDICNIQLQQ